MRHLEESFRILRVRMEAQVPLPALLIVSGAKRNDGATFVACGLARAFAEAGQRTLLVDANTLHPGVAEELDVPPLRPGRGRSDLDARGAEVPRLWIASLVSPADGATFGEANLGGTLEEMRSTYSVTIVDAPALPESSTALQFAHAADGLLLAVRLGRKPDRADNELKRLLGEEMPRLLGIVPTQARSRREGPGGGGASRLARLCAPVAAFRSRLNA
jgi:succinoglycan biosynthesis transport protein ExoP